MKKNKKIWILLLLICLVAGGAVYAMAYHFGRQQSVETVADGTAEQKENDTSETDGKQKEKTEEKIEDEDSLDANEADAENKQTVAGTAGQGVIPDDLPAKSLADDQSNKNSDLTDSGNTNGDSSNTNTDADDENKDAGKKPSSDKVSKPDPEDDEAIIDGEEPEDADSDTNENTDTDDGTDTNQPDPDEGTNEGNTSKSLTLAAQLEDFPVYDKAAESLPAAYSSTQHGNVTSVKTQSGNTCWAFAAVAAAESAILAQGESIDGQPAVADTLDLSEMQLAYFFYHSVADEYGNTAGDTTTDVAKDTNYLNVGGNSIFTTFALANWTGMVIDSLMPFQNNASKTFADTLAWSNDSVHLENSYWIAYQDTDEMKRAIIDYGGVAFNYFFSQADSCYNAQTGAYYYNGGASVNHASEIVGWDDTYRAENFKNNPGRDGAWLVKNSYGAGFGFDGYMWISYADRSFLNTTYKAYVFDMKTVDTSEHIYQYDGSNGYGHLAIPSGSMVANVFTVGGSSTGTSSDEAIKTGTSSDEAANTGTSSDEATNTGASSGEATNTGTSGEINNTGVSSDETITPDQKIVPGVEYKMAGGSTVQQLQAVSLALYETYANYSIQIYKNLTDTNDPTSGTPCLTTPVTGQTTFVGYYTIPLSQTITLQEGETFSVVATLSKNDDSAVDVFIDYSYDNSNWITFYNEVAAGQSFLKKTGENWNDLYDDMASSKANNPGYTIRLKAFAVQ